MESESSSEEGRKDSETRVGYLGDKLWVLEEAGKLLSDHADTRDESLPLRLSPLLSLLPHHVHIELLLLACQLLVVLQLLVELLLLHAGLELVLVLQRLTFHLFLTRKTLFVGLASLLAHLLFLLELLTITLEFKLHLVLSLALLRLLLELDSLALLLFLDLSFLNLKFPRQKGVLDLGLGKRGIGVRRKLRLVLTLCFLGALTAWSLLSSRRFRTQLLSCCLSRGI